MSILDKLLARVPKTSRPPSGGETRTPTFQPYAPYYQLAYPNYLDHLTDLSAERNQTDSRQIIKDLCKFDPDVSATIHAYLTLADTEMIAVAVDLDGAIVGKATRDVYRLLNRITRQRDYTKGYTLKESLDQHNANLRYMVLMRGGIADELVLDASRQPTAIRLIDSASLRWYEPEPGLYKPGQLVMGDPLPRLLDYPNFFTSFYRRDPTGIYTYSDFVSAINTVASRQQVINDLYRIMRITGFPRIDVKIMESVIVDNAPIDIKQDAEKMRAYVTAQLSSLAGQFATIRADQALTHSDSVDIKILNERSSGVAVDVNPVIDTLNAQNQAALKTMATIIGRGSAGVNTSSVEARIAAMYADQINKPVSENWGQILSYAMHQTGFQGYVNVWFRPSELRPDTELEPQRVLKASRLRQDLSDGIISDEEYTLEMYGRLPNKGAPTLSGTKFVGEPNATADEAADNAADVSPNSDPLGRSIAPAKTKMTKANLPKSRSKPKPK